MPITATLGALTYPRISESRVFPLGNGFGALIPGYQFIIGSTNDLVGAPGGNTPNSYTRGIGADDSGNMYFAGVIPGVGFPYNIAPTAGIFKLDSTTGAGIYDTGFAAGAGIAAVTNSNNDTVFTVEARVSAPSPIVQSSRGYQVNSSSNYVNYRSWPNRNTSGGYQSQGIKTDNSGNYYYFFSNSAATDIVSIAKLNSTNITTGALTVGVKANPFTILTPIDFCVDSDQNIYILVNHGGVTSVLSKFTWSGSFYTKTWSKQFNVSCYAIAANTTNVFVLGSQVIFKLDSAGAMVTQQGLFGQFGDIALSRLTIGDDGNLYSQTPFASWDTNLNLLWSNALGYSNLSGSIYFGPTGVAGIVVKGGYIYGAQTIGYQGSRCIFAWKVPSDGIVPPPGHWWLGNGYITYFTSSLTIISSSVTSTTSTLVISQGGSTGSGTTTLTGSPTQDGLVTNTEI